MLFSGIKVRLALLHPNDATFTLDTKRKKNQTLTIDISLGIKKVRRRARHNLSREMHQSKLLLQAKEKWTRRVLMPLFSRV
jgi:hypothetical protein